MENDKIVIPEVSSAQLFKLINHIYPSQQVPIERLNGIFGRSTVTNVAATGEGIGILKKEKSSIELTAEGLGLGRALASKNLEDQRRILTELALKNPVLEFVYSLIKEKKIMKNREIGQKIALQFNKNWKHELSYSRYGTNCGDLLAAAGLGDYVNGIYSIEKISVAELSEDVTSPSLAFEKIRRILKEIVSKDKNINDLSVCVSTSKNRLSYELNNCIDLNLIKKSGDIYSITPQGRDLINPLNTSEIQKNLFAEILRKSSYNKIVEIVEKNQGLDRRKIGEILAHELKKEAREDTQYDMGKKFANWLEAAGIIQIQKSKSSPEKRDKVNEKKEAVPKKAEKKQIIAPIQKLIGTPSIPSNSSPVSFNAGRLIERIEIKNSVNQDILDDLYELISVCGKDASLKPFINLLSLHLTLYVENKDFRIIQADLNFIKEKFDN